MSMDRKAQPETIALLPQADPRLIQALRDIAILGESLADFAGARMIAMSFPGRSAKADAVLAWDDRLARCASSEAMIARSGMVAPARKAMRLAVADLHARLSQWGWAPLGDAFGLVIEGTRVALLRAQDALPALGSTPVLWEDGAEGHAFGALDPDDAEMDAAYEATLH